METFVLQVVLVATMVVGVLGALGESAMRAILSFHMTSQVGYILLGLGFFGVPGLAAGIFYLVHHIIVKASLFLSCGAVERSYGTGELDRLGGVARRAPVLAVAFIVAALSLTGIPPFSGFIAKYTLVSAAVGAEQYVAAGFAVLVSLFTLLSMLKIWSGVFWGQDPDERGQEAERAPHTMAHTPTGADPDPTDPTSRAATATTGVAVADGSAAPQRRIRPALVLPALTHAVVTIGLGIGAQGLLELAGTAAEGLVDTSRYVEAVSAP